MKLQRVYVEKRKGFDLEAERLAAELRDFFGGQYSCLAKLRSFRVLCRYDVGGLSQKQFDAAVRLVFSEPQCDRVFVCDELPSDSGGTDNSGARALSFGVEYLPGQYDQKADSAEQCTELAVGVKPSVRCAKFYTLMSEEPFCGDAVKALQCYLVNPVDSRLVSDTVSAEAEAAGGIPVLTGFSGADTTALKALAKEYGLAMSASDIECCRQYFAAEGREPSLTELRILDTYWSDHCRHTTFTTILESIDIDESAGASAAALRRALSLYEKTRREVYGKGADKRPRTLMDMATIGTRALKKRGLLDDLDESPEINACTIKVKAKIENSGRDGGKSVHEEPYLLLFKNETHNHPTEIEPFGGAATCLGGAIRDPLSGRAYVYQAMRITGAADPRRPLLETLPGKLPQIKIAREAAAGYSSYGNQIGLATGQVAEFYHPGYAAKRLELGAVIGAAPESQVRRVPPVTDDVVLLVGGKTGRDGIGGATGSSKIHSGESVETAGAEVQKGNAVEERKLQRLFRDPEVSTRVKRCNDFGAGGVSVAVGELAPGLDINLDAVPKKYAGLDGTELAISESQERMAVVVAPKDSELIIQKATAENLDAVIIAKVTHGETEDKAESAGAGKSARLTMRWQGNIIADLSRAFLDSNGAPRSAAALITGNNAARSSGTADPSIASNSPAEQLEQIKAELGSLRSCSRRGLQERFDGSIGALSVLFPWGGKEQATPECGMAALLPVLPSLRENADCGQSVDAAPRSLTASIMSFGFDPARAKADPYVGAKGAVKEALAKFSCLGGDYRKARLSMQEYFERMETCKSWGKAAAALLGALEAQLALEVPAIGGKDSMSGTYRDPANGIDLAVPPTLVAFAAGTADASAVRSGTLSGRPGNPIILLYDDEKRDEWETFKTNMKALAALAENGLSIAAYPVGAGGTGAALALMAFGNNTGLEPDSAALDLVNEQNYPGAVLVELDGKALAKPDGEAALDKALRNAVWKGAARTLSEPVFRIRGAASGKNDFTGAALPLAELREIFEEPLRQVYPQKPENANGAGANRDRFDEVIGNAKNNRRGARAVNRAGTKLPSVRPLVALPVFPGTNCEWDMERAFRESGARTRLVIFRNRSADDIADSLLELTKAVTEAQILAISGGFSAGDEPDGSGKFIANVFRAPVLADAVRGLLEKRDGLMLGICNGFQALIKLGLVPYGEYRNAAENAPTLTYNNIGRHVSRMTRTVTLPSASPWLALEEPGAVHILPVSHGEGRFAASRAETEALFKAGQVPFCYCDDKGRAALAEPDNPNGSDYAVEALTSPDGRVLGKMGHSERRGQFVHINIPGNKHMRIFEAGVRYFL